MSLMLVICLCVSLLSPIGPSVVRADGVQAQNTDKQVTVVGEGASGEATSQYSIELSEGAEDTLEIEGTIQLTPVMKDSAGVEVHDATFTYSSDHPGYATVSESGLVTAIAKGSAIITVNGKSGENTATTTFTVEVTEKAVAVESVTLESETKTLFLGQTYTITPTILPETASKEVDYEILEGTEVVSVGEDGVVKALAVGMATIKVASKTDSEKCDELTVWVLDVPTSIKLSVESFSVEETESIDLNEKITATLVYADGTEKTVDNSQLNFTLQENYLGTLENGIFTAKDLDFVPQIAHIDVVYTPEFPKDYAGELTKLEPVSATCSINIVAVEVKEIKLENKETAITLKMGETYTLLPVVLPANASDKSLTFTSSDKDVAKVDEKGVITAEDIGEAVITVAATSKPEVKVEFKVTVFQTQFNIVELGANGSDTKVDNKIINQALKYADHDLMKGHTITVTVPAGTYYIEKTLNLYSNTNLLLADGATIIRKASAGGNAMLRSYVRESVGGYAQCENVTINGGVWDGNANGSKDSDCIYIGHAQNVTISNTVVKNNSGAHLIELTGVNNALIENVELYGYTICKEKGYSSVQAEKEAIQLDYCSSNSAKAMKPYDLTPCKNVIIRNCNIHDYMCGIGAHGSRSDVYLENIFIQNNKFENITNACIDLRNFLNVNVTGNKASKHTTFLYASGSTGAITNNSVKNKSFKTKSSTGLLAKNGITVSNKSSFTITDNTINKHTSNGICVWNGSTAVIKNNTIKSNKLYGIRTQGSTITLEKNKFSKNKKGLYDTYKDAKVKSSDDICAYYINIKKEYKYTGKKIKPKVKIKNLKKKYYKVSYKNNKNVGTATITIKGKGKVKGTLKKTFKIVNK